AMDTPMVLVDFGSTFTKVALVDAASGHLLGTAQHRTTVDSDLMAGLDLALDSLRARFGPATASSGGSETRACSSAAGGLKIAVVGLEPDLTVAAAREVVLSSGGRVVDLATAPLTDGAIETLGRSTADLVLIVGGTDGGNATFVVDAARALVAAGVRQPVIYAGNADARVAVGAILERGGLTWRAAANVLPEIGNLAVEEAQGAIRRDFLEHVIRGRHLSADQTFSSIVRHATPEAVLAGVDLMASGTPSERGTGPILVVDVGGATTDVYSSLGAQQRRSRRGARFVPQRTTARTVEGDLGVRWGAPSLVEAARDLGLLEPEQLSGLREAAERRHADPAFVPSTAQDVADDLALARLAIAVAVVRHAGRERITVTQAGAEIRQTGRDLRAIETVVLTGGIFRAHPDAFSAPGHLHPGLDGFDRRRAMLPRPTRVVVDAAYVLASAGLLAETHPDAALRLMRQSIARAFPVPIRSEERP
ncbi:MAG: glutamate mutase L, partial [Thermoanaerobaculia bacterium]|nr:glutamate mutase L [Thermoanaerobaculia bacterium]